MLGLLRIAVLLAAGLVLGHALVQPETFGELFSELGTHIEKELEAATTGPAPAPLGEDWATVLIGAPSGAAWLEPSPQAASYQPEPLTIDPSHPANEPRPLSPAAGGSSEVALPTDLPPNSDDSVAVDWVAVETEAAPVGEQLPDFTLEIRSGQTLSQVAQDHYGTYRSGVLEALVDYNGLKNANAITAGQTIALPEREKLMAWAAAAR